MLVEDEEDHGVNGHANGSGFVRDLKEFDGSCSEPIGWIDDIIEEQIQFKGDLVKEVDIMEKMNEIDFDASDESDVDN